MHKSGRESVLIVLSADLSFHVSHFDLNDANSSSKAAVDGDKGDSLQGGKRCCLGQGTQGPGKIH